MIHRVPTPHRVQANRSHMFHRSQRGEPPVAIGGIGPYLIDRDGKRYLDGSGGAAVSCLGHSDAHVIDAMKAQLDRLAFAHTGFFTNEPAEALAELIAARAGDGLDRVYFVSGGSEANETAVKMARQYFVEKGEPQRRHIIARRQSYHGNTLGVLAVGGSPGRKAPYGPLLLDNISHVSACYPYREKWDDESEEAYGSRLAAELEAEIQRLGPDTVMAFIAETVGGATAGALTPVTGYFKHVREICDRHGILLILDEVMCGMGRTGRHFAYEDEGITPDIVTNAKGLGAGYMPIGSVTVSDTIHEAFTIGSGAFKHGHTYVGHALACAAAYAVQTEVDRLDLLRHVRAQGKTLSDMLQHRFADRPWFGEQRGRGLFQAVEIVADRDLKTPYAAECHVASRIKAEAMDRGLICYPGSGTVDGSIGDHVLLAPPFIVEDAHLEELVDKLDGAIEAAVTGGTA